MDGDTYDVATYDVATYDVAIVGGGIIGSAIAYFLGAEPAFTGSVAVVEPDPTYAEASTPRSAGADVLFDEFERLLEKRGRLSVPSSLIQRLALPSGVYQRLGLCVQARGPQP